MNTPQFGVSFILPRKKKDWNNKCKTEVIVGTSSM